MNNKQKYNEVELDDRTASFFIGDNDKDQAPIKLVGPDYEEIPQDEIIVAPDGGWGWVVAIASFFSNVVVDGILFSFGLLQQPIMESFIASGQTHVTVGSLTWMSSILNGCYLMGGPFVSALANKFGFRVVAIMGSVIGSIGFISSYLICRETPSLPGLYLFYGIIGGLGFNLLYVPSVIAVGFYFEKYRALATGIAICGSGVGTFVFAPLTYYLISVFGWRLTLVFHGGFVLACSICGAMYRPVKPKAAVTSKEKSKDGQEQKQVTPFPTPDGTPLLMRIKRAREMEKWDSSNSVEKMGAADRALAARQASTQSLNNPLPLHKQAKRMSVPAMNLSDDVAALVRTNTQSSVRTRVKGDLKGIEEEHEELNEEEEAPTNPPTAQQQQAEERQQQQQQRLHKISVASSGDGSLLNKGSFMQAKIGNSTLIIDEMTKSRILHVSSKSIINKPLYRDDIFYSGSLRKIPEYKDTVEKGAFSSREWSAIAASKPKMSIVSQTGTLKDAEEGPPAKAESKFCKCLSKLHVIQKMLDISLLASPTFLLISVSGAVTMAGFFVPFIFLKPLAMQYGIQEDDTPLLISVIGIANTVGRVFFGWLADRPNVEAIVLNNVSLTISGIVTLVTPFLRSYWQFVCFSLSFGLSLACYVSLRSILLVELLGLNRLTNAFGLLCLFQGVAALVGAPLAGILYDATGNYDITFYVSGGLMLLSGIMCYPLGCINRWEKSKGSSGK